MQPLTTPSLETPASLNLSLHHTKVVVIVAGENYDYAPYTGKVLKVKVVYASLLHGL